MTQYVDSSALLKRYLDEDDSERFNDLLISDREWVFAQHTLVEVRRALAREYEGSELNEKRAVFAHDWAVSRVVALDDATCEFAADLAETTGLRTPDALHLAAAQRVGGGALSFVTADLRQAQVARSLGWTVLGS